MRKAVLAVAAAAMLGAGGALWVEHGLNHGLNDRGRPPAAESEVKPSGMSVHIYANEVTPEIRADYERLVRLYPGVEIRMFSPASRYGVAGEEVVVFERGNAVERRKKGGGAFGIMDYAGNELAVHMGYPSCNREGLYYAPLEGCPLDITVGDLAPDFTAMAEAFEKDPQDPTGERVVTKTKEISRRGLTDSGKVLGLYFWSVECPPSTDAREVDAFRGLSEKYWGNEGVAIVGISIDGQERRGSARPFAMRSGVPCLHVFDDTGTVKKIYEVYSPPKGFVIGPDGVIRAETAEGGMPQMGEAIERLLIERGK